MDANALNCPKCGAPLDPSRRVAGSSEIVQCTYCGSRFRSDESAADAENEGARKVGKILFAIDEERRKIKAEQPIDSRTEIESEPGVRFRCFIPSPLNRSDIRFRYGCLSVNFTILLVLVGFAMLRRAHWSIVAGAIVAGLLFMLFYVVLKEERTDETIVADGDGLHRFLERGGEKSVLHIPWREVRKIELTFQFQIVADSGDHKIGSNLKPPEQRLLFEELQRFVESMTPPS